MQTDRCGVRDDAILCDLKALAAPIARLRVRAAHPAFPTPSYARGWFTQQLGRYLRGENAEAWISRDGISASLMVRSASSRVSNHEAKAAYSTPASCGVNS